MGCPYGSYKNECEKELALLNDNQRKYVIKLFKESYDVLGIDYKNKQLKSNFNDGDYDYCPNCGQRLE